MNEVTRITRTGVAQRINERWQQIQHHAEYMVRNAIEIGQLLVEQKDVVPHGQWQFWLETNCPQISERHARRFMLMAANADRIAGIADAPSIRDALRLIAEERVARKKIKVWARRKLVWVNQGCAFLDQAIGDERRPRKLSERDKRLLKADTKRLYSKLRIIHEGRND